MSEKEIRTDEREKIVQKLNNYGDLLRSVALQANLTSWELSELLTEATSCVRVAKLIKDGVV
ncbi:hypothetical protein AB0K16_22095 [Nonomuraea jabiensis]|uniref:hypothetical protein n=1 Tax=Nonomuraea jabiensis TaxID=882448 RepID=UPI0034305826